MQASDPSGPYWPRALGPSIRATLVSGLGPLRADLALSHGFLDQGLVHVQVWHGTQVRLQVWPWGGAPQGGPWAQPHFVAQARAAAREEARDTWQTCPKEADGYQFSGLLALSGPPMGGNGAPFPPNPLWAHWGPNWDHGLHWDQTGTKLGPSATWDPHGLGP